MITADVGLSISYRLQARQYQRAEENLAEARLQRQRAAYNFGEILERLTFLIKVLREAKPGEPPESLALRAEMSGRVIDFLHTALDERADEPTMRLEAVYARTNLGKIHDWLGESAEARSRSAKRA